MLCEAYRRNCWTLIQTKCQNIYTKPLFTAFLLLATKTATGCTRKKNIAFQTRLTKRNNRPRTKEVEKEWCHNFLTQQIIDWVCALNVYFIRKNSMDDYISQLAWTVWVISFQDADTLIPALKYPWLHPTTN